MAEQHAAFEVSADRPIESIDQDLLNRSGFARALANSLRQWRSKESIVVAVYGEWGQGKTSVKNLVLSDLRGGQRCPTIIEFNPWNWTGQESLLSAFFDEIGAAIGSRPEIPDRAELARKWRKYGTRLAFGATVLDAVASGAGATGIPLIAPVLGYLSKALRRGSHLTKSAADVHETGNTPGPSLQELRKSLRDALKDLETPLLIVMDDVDRLNSEEIRLLVRLVKVNADLPNVTYLLLFDRAAAELALDESSGRKGREYLEKIVQAGFDLPLVERSDIDRVFNSGLEELLQPIGPSTVLDSDRWHGIYQDHGRAFLRSIRDVRRFLSTFSFEIGLYYSDDVLEVNPIDLLIVELLHVFEPELYGRLPQSSSTLIGDPYGANRSKEMANVNGEVEVLLKAASESRRDASRGLLKALFPKVDWAANGRGYGIGFEEGWERDLRICHYGMFRRYFVMSLPKGDVPKSILLEICRATSRGEIVAILRRMHESGRLDAMLGRMVAYANDIAIRSASLFVDALFEVEDIIATGSSSVFGADVEAAQFVHKLLMREKDPVARGRILLGSMETTTAVWLPIRLVDFETPEADQPNWNRQVLDAQGIDEAKSICLMRIRESGLHGLEGLHLGLCLLRWQEWAGDAEVREWVANNTRDLLGTLRILGAFVHTTVGGHPSKVVHYLKLTELEQFADVSSIEATIAPAIATWRESPAVGDALVPYWTAIEAFLDAVKRRNAGKQDELQDILDADNESE